MICPVLRRQNQWNVRAGFFVTTARWQLATRRRTGTRPGVTLGDGGGRVGAGPSRPFRVADSVSVTARRSAVRAGPAVRDRSSPARPWGAWPSGDPCPPSRGASALARPRCVLAACCGPRASSAGAGCGRLGDARDLTAAAAPGGRLRLDEQAADGCGEQEQDRYQNGRPHCLDEPVREDLARQA